MRKDWLGVALISLVLAGCATDEQQTQTAPPQPAYSGPVVEIPGVDPKYEPINPSTNQDYSVNGKNYRIVKNPANFSEVGLATWYGDEAQGSRTATGETFDPNAYTAAHPTLPLPSYVRVTNLANGRQLVVRVNDRGPYTPGRIIDLSRAAGDRLNISNNTRVRVDYISVAPDGTLSGPGTIGTTVAKQSYALPARPDLDGGMTTGGGMQTGGVVATGGLMNGGDNSAATQPVAQPAADDQNVDAIDNSTLKPSSSLGAPVQSGGFLGAPQPLRSGVLEESTPEPAAVAAPAVVAAPVVSAAPRQSAPVASSGLASGYVVQVGAVNDSARAHQLMQSLSKRFGVPGRVEANGSVFRIQLGGYSSRSQASALQQRLSSEAQLNGFITTAH
ncbi:endolytic peptidoglycan transglycosylase RlpA [Pantoea sp. A4]|uniref:endolytic peptidoglycan transglycosylase RlpA n=1 Tax=Pantoea sp. A4 TaxID=1225184 RepID=UPI000380FB4F|nr:endolytic peptidoglycan transglycosylase RlpA [Pantoea sp. A4]